MQLITQNPYHVLGLLADSNEREIEKQKAKIKAFQNVGKPIEFNSDLAFAGNPDRSPSAIEKALSSIAINQNKVFNGLFWLTDNNHLDNTALSYLASVENAKAEEIWTKVTTGKDVSAKNFSAFNNLGTILLSKALHGSTIDHDLLETAIRLKVALLTSDHFKNFCHSVADETYTVDKEKELESFLTALLDELQKTYPKESSRIPALLGNLHPQVKTILSDKLTDAPIHNIERRVDQTKKARTDSPEEGFDLAKALYKDTKADLKILAGVLDKTDLKYKMVADKVAKEMLQCGIDYFNEYKNDEDLHDGDLGDDILAIFKKAKTIAAGEQALDRIKENTEGLKEWIDNAEERRKSKLIGEELAFITRKLERSREISATLENAEDLITSCKPRLQQMKSALGQYDEFYIKVSSAVASTALSMIVDDINRQQNGFDVRNGNFIHFRQKVNKAIELLDTLQSFDMNSSLQQHYRNNLNTLRSINSRINQSGNATTYTSNYEFINVLKIFGGIIVLILLARACAG